MNALEGYRTLLLALLAFVYGMYLLWTGDQETGTAMVGLALAQVGVRHTTSGPAAWRKPPRPRRPRHGGDDGDSAQD